MMATEPCPSKKSSAGHTGAAKDPYNDPLFVPENYVQHTLLTTTPLPPITSSSFFREVEWISVFALTFIPAASLYGALTTTLRLPTFLLAFAYYFYTGLSITAGYHRLWAHRSYNASLPLQIFLLLGASGAVQGSVKWWSRGHRAHHRYTDTDLDPYNALRGFFYSHIGWMLLRPRRTIGKADVSDLGKDPLLQWQHRHFTWLIFIMAFGVPTAIAHFGWGDAKGGFVYAGIVRLLIVHHSTFCVNSLAHWIGDSPFDDKHTPKNHFLTAIVTVGEGYHNFHHQFPTDYRNAIEWYQYDPTKWFIWLMECVGLASQLKMFPSNEIQKGELLMEMKRLREKQERVEWCKHADQLPVVSYESFQKQSTKRPLVLVSGFIHDLSGFLEHHPGGKPLLARYIGKDATTAFFGGVYDHSHAAHNLLSMKRVGILDGGHPHILDIAKLVPPGELMRVVKFGETFPPSGSWAEGEETAWSDEDAPKAVKDIESDDSASPIDEDGHLFKTSAPEVSG
ncbi:delta 9-fatty acid desaturase [Armillaria solidipes]|uniref:Delta 9-fatty acid desaturase n=1 Tax=Armillaria solidipes TaxID=1076256 RepID=A0A2H3C6M9_9AGAR|nr:delta 9-fatty acid desaturase [Armillaria solidipes]